MFDYLSQAQGLRAAEQPFVLATVVQAHAPTSAKAGAKAMNDLKAAAAAELDKQKAAAEAKLKAEAEARLKAETDKLAALLTQIERLPETKEFYERLGAEVMNGGADEMRKFQAAEIALWKRIAVKAKVEQE